MPVSPDDASDLSAETASAYAQAELSLLGRLAAFIGLNLASEAWSTDRRNSSGLVRRAVIRLLGPLFLKGRRAAARAIREAERRGVAQADSELGAMSAGLPPPPGVSAAYSGLNNDLSRVEQGISAQAMSVYHRVITEVTQAVEAGTATRLKAAERALARFADAGVTGFVDRSGRKWELTTYVEMAVRTHAANVMIKAHLDRLTAAGVGLVMVSEAPYECDLCKKWEGRILAIQGPAGQHTVKVKQGGRSHKVDVYGSLGEARAAGLFHPNCRHNITGYQPGVSTSPAKSDTHGVSYQHTQQQRKLERAARKWDRRRAVALTDEERRKATARFKAYRAQIRKLTDQTGLPRKTNRERHDTTR